MWTLAGLLSWTAVGIRYFGTGTMNWFSAVAGLVCMVMGLAAWTRRSTGEPAPADGRDTPPKR